MVARILFGVFIISFAQAKSLSTKEPKKHGHSQFSVINCDDQTLGKNIPRFNTKNGIGIDWDGNDDYIPEDKYKCINRSSILIQQTFAKEMCRTPPSGYHLCLYDKINYSEFIPIGGPHRPVWVTYGEYVYMPPQRWVHAIEHGAAVFLYNPCADSKEIENFKKLAKRCLRRHVITPNNNLPQGELFNVRHAINEGPEFHIIEDGEYKFGLVEKAKILTDLSDSKICPFN